MEVVQFNVSEDIVLEADAWGSADRPAVLFAHGGGQTRHSWGSTARAFERDGWFAVSIDLRGHGKSGWSPSGDYALPSHAEDLRVAARELGRPVLVGASLGGLAGLLAEGESPENIFSALVLVDVTPWPNPDGAHRIRSFMRANLEHGFATIEEVIESIAGYLPHRKRRFDPDSVQKNLRTGEDGRLRWHWDPKILGGPDRTDHSPLGPGMQERLERAASRLEIPVLLVRGKSSDVVTQETVDKFLRLVPHAQAVDVSGAGHMVAGDNNDIFTRAVSGFLEKLEPTQPDN